MKQSLLSKSRRRSSTRDIKLFRERKSFSERRESSNLDFDLSKLRHSQDQRFSFPSMETIDITPFPAEQTKQKQEKKVVFKIDHFPVLAKTRSSTINLEFSKRIISTDVMEDAVMYSLDHKDEFFQDFTSFLQYEDFLNEEQSQTMLLTDQGQGKMSSVALEGNLQRLGISENHVLKFNKIPSSRRVSLGGSSGRTTSDEFWPWPWLNPQMRARFLFRSSSYNRVTFSHQNRLPKIPFPVLGNSLNSYLQSVKPCVSSKTFAVTQKVFNDFARDEGSVYHEHLIKTVELMNTNWIRESLPNYSHCYSRKEAPLMNTAIVAPFMYDLWPDRMDTQLSRAAILVELVVEFWQLIRDERLLPISITTDGQPACMHQFRKLFSSVRLPGIPRDEIYYRFKTHFEETSTPRHIVVFYKGQIFSMEVVDSGYASIGLDEIKSRLEAIMMSVDEDNCQESAGVGILTSLDRNAWSEHRVHLMQLNTDNQACLNEIEEAMFVLSLDHTKILSMDRLLHEAIFADGCNRWYDKSLSFYVYKNGLVTVSVNSSILDGTTVAFLLHYIHLRIMEDAEKWDDDVLQSVSGSQMEASQATSRIEALYANISSQASSMSDMALAEDKLGTFSKESNSRAFDEIKALIFDIDETLETVIEAAKINFLEMSCSFRTAVCRFEDYESNIFNIKEINTDAFAHLVMQLTYFRMYYRPASQASKASLRRFHYGRYEIIRTTTSEAVSWCKTMLDPESSFEDRSKQFFKAEKKLVFLLKNVSIGKGCENHLAALRVIAEDVYSTTPALFQDEGFHLAGGFGRFDIYAECLGVGCTSCSVVLPTSPAGYGVGFFVASSKIVFNVSCWEDQIGSSAELFAKMLNYTLKELHEFLRSL